MSRCDAARRLMTLRVSAIFFGGRMLLASVADVMGLDVKDERLRRLPRVGRGGFQRFDGINLEESSENRVQREEGGGHSRAGCQEVTPAHSEEARIRSCGLLEQPGDALVLERLGQGDVLLVRDDLRQERRKSIGL